MAPPVMAEQSIAVEALPDLAQVSRNALRAPVRRHGHSHIAAGPGAGLRRYSRDGRRLLSPVAFSLDLLADLFDQTLALSASHQGIHGGQALEDVLAVEDRGLVDLSVWKHGGASAKGAIDGRSADQHGQVDPAAI